VPTRFILIADDFAMTRGISEGILALAEAGRLSGTGAMVNMPRWPAEAAAAAKLRDRFALGLHLNLTFGRPLGPMPRLAPDGMVPAREKVIGRAASRQIDRAEVGAEIERQLDRFQEFAGTPPDFIDGHHHVHGLPGIRDALVEALKRRFPAGGPLIRDPADRLPAIARRRVAATKAAAAALLVAGLRRLAAGAGFATNSGFSGFSTFGTTPYADEFPAFLIDPGSRPMIMCHPGRPDPELGAGDPIERRRPEELAYLAVRPDLPDLIWRPARRDAAGFPWTVGAHG
jgi:predicted glycoside hydrolase/deacetylase ChbG (UPF0249 family)